MSEKVVLTQEQAERVQELVYENFQLKDDVNRLENEYLHGVKQQNNRYREALELIRKKGTYGTSVNTGEIVRSNEANIAEKALEGEKNEQRVVRR